LYSFSVFRSSSASSFVSFLFGSSTTATFFSHKVSGALGRASSGVINKESDASVSRFTRAGTGVIGRLFQGFVTKDSSGTIGVSFGVAST
jgi:hypothetical protein